MVILVTKAEVEIAGAERLSNQAEPLKWLYLFYSSNSLLFNLAERWRGRLCIDSGITNLLSFSCMFLFTVDYYHHAKDFTGKDFL
jgi:hypothetical protein